MPLTMTIVLNLTEEARALDALERPEGGKSKCKLQHREHKNTYSDA